MYMFSLYQAERFSHSSLKVLIYGTKYHLSGMVELKSMVSPLLELYSLKFCGFGNIIIIPINFLYYTEGTEVYID